MKCNQMTEESLKHRLVPFSLKEKAKPWLLPLQPGTFPTWVDLAKAFYRKFCSKQKTAFVRETVNTFHQSQGQIFFTYFERFKDHLIECSYYGFEKNPFDSNVV